jgi:putative heme-binding domain-containing protein
LPLEKLNTNKGSGIGTFGLHDPKIIVPGDPYRSLLLYRMSKLGYARMPYIGSRVVDSAGVSLIEAWIRSLPGTPTADSSAPITAHSAEANALQLLTTADSALPQQHDAALSTLLQSSEGALALALRLHRGGLSEGDSRRAIALGIAAPTSDTRGLFETFVPESQRRATLGPNADPQAILSRRGDAARGKLIFFSDGARCRNCHELDDRAKSLGPTLLEIKKKYPRPADLLPHVLQPSLKIDEPFAAYVIAIDDGRVVSGMIAEQNENEIVLKTAERLLVRIARRDIEEQRKSDKSLMPERILSDLTAQEASDLVEYIRSAGDMP